MSEEIVSSFSVSDLFVEDAPADVLGEPGAAPVESLPVPPSLSLRQRIRSSLTEAEGVDPQRFNQALREGPAEIPPSILANSPDWPDTSNVARDMGLIEQRPKLGTALTQEPNLAHSLAGGGWPKISRALDDFSPWAGFKNTAAATSDQLAGSNAQIQIGYRASLEMMDDLFGTATSSRDNRRELRRLSKIAQAAHASQQGLNVAQQAVSVGVGMLPHTAHSLAARGLGAATALIPGIGGAVSPVATVAFPVTAMAITEGGNFYWSVREAMPELDRKQVATMGVLVGMVNGALEQLPLETAVGNLTGQASRAARTLLADRRFRDLALHAMNRLAIQSGTEGFTEFAQEVGPVIGELVLQYARGDISMEDVFRGVVSPEAMRRYGESAYLGFIGAPVVGGVTVTGGLIGQKFSVDRAKENRALFEQIADTAIDNKDLIDQMPDRYHKLMTEALDDDGQIEGVYINPEDLVAAYVPGSDAYNALFEAVPDLSGRLQLAFESGSKVRFDPGEFATFMAGGEQFQAIGDLLSFEEDQPSLFEANELASPAAVESLRGQLESLRESLETDPVRDREQEKFFSETLDAMFAEALPSVSAGVRTKAAETFSRMMVRVSEMDGTPPLDLMADVLDRLTLEQRPELDSPAEVARTDRALRDATILKQVRAAAVRVTDPVTGESRVFEGPNHGEAFEAADEANALPENATVEDLFATDDGRLLTREEAATEFVPDLQHPTLAPQGKATTEDFTGSNEVGFDAESTETERFKQAVPAERISTRRPTAVKATEDPMAEDLSVSVEAIARTAPDAHAKLAEHLRSYTSLRPREGESDAATIKRFQKMVRDNLRWLWEQVPEEVRERTRHWYIGANAVAQEWADAYGHDIHAVAGTIAALSPQKDWYMNVSIAERVLDVMHHDQAHVLTDEEAQTAIDRNEAALKADKKKTPKARKSIAAQFRANMDAIRGVPLAEIEDPKAAALFIRTRSQAIHDPSFRTVSPEGVFGEVVMGDKGPHSIAWNSYSEIGKAVTILRNPDRQTISDQLGEQHKVRSFFNNIVDPTNADDVTIDTHAVAAALLKPLASNGREVQHNFGMGGGSSQISGTSGTYAIYADAYREIANELGVLPREVQSVTWEAVRSLFTPAFKGADKKPKRVEGVWERYHQGKLSAPKAREVIHGLAGGIEAPDSVSAASQSEGRRTSFAEGVAGARDVPRLAAGESGRASGGSVRFRSSEVLAGDGQDQGVDPVEAAVAHHNRTFLQRVGDGAKSILKMVAFHGSPHDHDKFSNEKIGTGEGAQAFGWGLYFSSSRKIAEWYRENLTGGPNTEPELKVTRATVNGEDVSDLLDPESGIFGQPIGDGLIDRYYAAEEGSEEQQRTVEAAAAGVVAYLKAGVRTQYSPWPAMSADEIEADPVEAMRLELENFEMAVNEGESGDAYPIVLEILNGFTDGAWTNEVFDVEATLDESPRGKGQLFEVNLPEESELMDWDAPFSEQSELVQTALRNVDSIVSQNVDIDNLSMKHVRVMISKLTGEPVSFGLQDEARNRLRELQAQMPEQFEAEAEALGLNSAIPLSALSFEERLAQMTTDEIAQMMADIDPNGEWDQTDIHGEPISEEEWRENLLDTIEEMESDGDQPISAYMSERFGESDLVSSIYRNLSTRIRTLRPGFNPDRAISEALAAAGVKGHKYKSEQLSGGRGRATNFVIYDDAAIEIQQKFYQRLRSGPQQVTRGQLVVDRQIQKFLLQIAEGSVNDATLIHELAHLALEVVLDVADGPNASSEIKGYAAEALEFLGVESRDQIGSEHHERWAESWELYLSRGEAPTPELRSLFRFWFQRFKQVYRAIRDQLMNADQDLSFVPLFDRLLASEDEIRAAAAGDAMMTPYLSEEMTSVMTPEEIDDIEKRLRRVQASERKKLEAKIAREDERILKIQKSELRDEVEREVYGDRVQKLSLWLRTGRTVSGEPIRVFGPTNQPLDRQRLSGAGIDAVAGDTTMRKSLPKGTWQRDGGLQPSLVAMAAGFATPEEMLVELANAENPKTLIERLVHERAQARGLIATREELQDAAAQSVDWAARDRLYEAQRRIAKRLRAESGALGEAERRRLQGDAAPTAKAARERLQAAKAALEEAIGRQAPAEELETLQIELAAAEAGVGAAKEARADQQAAKRKFVPDKVPTQVLRATARKLVNEIQFGDLRREVRRWKQVRSKASLRQTRAALARDWDTLAEAIDQEQLANAMAEEGVARLEEVQKWRRLILSFDKGKKRARLSKYADYTHEPTGEVTNVMDVIDGLLELVDFRNIPLSKIKHAAEIKGFAKDIEDELGIVIPMPGWVVGLEERPNYKQMTVGQLEDLYTGVKALETFGMNLVKEREDAARSEERSENEEMRGVLDGMKPAAFAESQKLGPSNLPKGKMALAGYIGAQMSFESFADFLDGLNPEGAFNRYFVQRFQAAARMEKKLTKMVSDRVTAAWDVYSTAEKSAFARVPIMIHSLGETMTKNEIMAIAANMGNQHNRDALQMARAYPLTDEQLNEILSHVNDRDASYLIEVAEAINLLWEPAAAAEKAINGVVPPKVEGDPWQLPSGRWMPGFYFPLDFNPNLDERSADQHAREIGKGIMPPGGGSSMSKAGAMHARKATSGKLTVNADFNSVLQKHVSSMAKDIAWRGTIVKAQRQLRELAPELKRVMGVPAYGELKEYLKRQSTRLRQADQGHPHGLLKTLQASRQGLGLSVMAWRFVQAAIQASGFVVAIPKVGAANIAWGFQDIWAHGNPFERIAGYQQIIPSLADRAESFDRDAQRESLRLNPFDPRHPVKSIPAVRAFSMQYGYTMLAMVDMFSTTAVAAGAYHRAMQGKQEGIDANDAAAAARYADKIVRTTQGSGGAVNMPRILDSGEMMKLLTPMMTYSNTQFQQAVVHGLLAAQEFGDPNAPKSAIPGLSKNQAKFLSLWFFGYMVEPMLSESMRFLLNSAMGPDEPDEDEFFQVLYLRALAGPFGSDVLLRNAEGIARGFSPDTPLSDLMETVYNAAIKEPSKLFIPGKDFEMDRWIRSLAVGTTYATGLPTKQMLSAAEVLTQEAIGRGQR